jgi:fatty-acid desaturase
LAWYEVDISWMTIRMLQALGIAKAVKVAKIGPVAQRKVA